MNPSIRVERGGAEIDRSGRTLAINAVERQSFFVSVDTPAGRSRDVLLDRWRG